MGGVKRLLVYLVLLFTPAIGWADGPSPRPPCEGEPSPAYAPLGKPPMLAAWGEAELRRTGWRMPPCLSSTDVRTRMVTVLAAELPFTGSLDDLLARFGALSHYPSIRFWSVLNQEWRNLVSASGLLDGPDAQIVRPDPAGSDFVAGRDMYYFEVNRTGRVVHHLRVNARSDDRVVLTDENVTQVRYSMLTLFEPRALQTALFLEKRRPDVWGLYQMTRIGGGADFLAAASSSSYLNRLMALYRYLAGIPTDLEPPAAPR